MVLLESKVKSTENDSHRLFQIVPRQLGLPDTSPTVPQLYNEYLNKNFHSKPNTLLYGCIYFTIRPLGQMLRMYYSFISNCTP